MAFLSPKWAKLVSLQIRLTQSLKDIYDDIYSVWQISNENEYINRRKDRPEFACPLISKKLSPCQGSLKIIFRGRHLLKLRRSSGPKCV